MRSLTAALVGIGLVGGAAVATVSYQQAGGGPATTPTAAMPLPTARPTVIEDRLRPCEHGWRLTKGGACVRVVTKVVADGVPAASVRADAPAARPAAGSHPVVRTTQAAHHQAAPHPAAHSEASRPENSDDADDAVTTTEGDHEDREHGDEVEEQDD